MIVDLGLTRDSVLCAAILLRVKILGSLSDGKYSSSDGKYPSSAQELRVLRWTELGEILQVRNK